MPSAVSSPADAGSATAASSSADKGSATLHLTDRSLVDIQGHAIMEAWCVQAFREFYVHVVRVPFILIGVRWCICLYDACHGCPVPFTVYAYTALQLWFATLRFAVHKLTDDGPSAQRFFGHAICAAWLFGVSVSCYYVHNSILKPPQFSAMGFVILTFIFNMSALFFGGTGTWSPLHRCLAHASVIYYIVGMPFPVSSLGTPLSVAVMSCGMVIDELAGFVVARRSRRAFVCSIPEKELRALLMADTAASIEKRDQSLQRHLLNHMDTISLSFVEPQIERDYRARTFSESRAIFFLGIMIAALLLGANGIVFPIPLCSTPMEQCLRWLPKALFFLFVVGLRVSLNSPSSPFAKDQHAAAIVFSWGVCAAGVFGFLLTAMGQLQSPPRVYELPAAALFVPYTLMLMFAAVWAPLLGMTFGPRLISEIIAVVAVALQHPLTDLDSRSEAVLLAGSLLLGELCGHTLEYSRRQHYVENESRVLRAIETEAKAERARTQAEMVCYLVHEMRNDLNGITGASSILAEAMEAKGRGSRGGGACWDLTDLELAKMARDSYANARHALDVINNMLDFTKMEVGKLDLRREPFDIRALFDESVRLTSHLLHEKPKVSMSVEVTPPTREPSPQLLGSPFQLQQTLINLLSNACKYTEAGSVTLRMHMEVQEPSTVEHSTERSARLWFEVADTGCSVPEDRRELIFGAFEQAGGKMPGTGLGLALSRRMVHAMGGVLELECPESGGSNFKFTLSLPVAQQEDSAEVNAQKCDRDNAVESAASEPEAAEQEELLSGLRILVADDSRLNRKVLIHTLKKVVTDSQFTEAATGEAALDILSDPLPGRRIDIALVDQHFGDMKTENEKEDVLLSGFEVTRRVRALEASRRELEPDAQSVIIIGQTALADAVDHEANAIAAGQDAVFNKPLSPAAKVREALLRLLVKRRDA